MPVQSKFVRRCEFHRRTQEDGETVNQYVAALRKATAYCEFRELDDVLLEELISGVRDISFQRRLLGKPNFTLQTTLDEARATESSSKSAAALQKTSSSSNLQQKVTVHRESDEREESTNEDEDICNLWAEKKKVGPNPEDKQLLCAGCGGKHPRAACRYWDAICQQYDHKGHLARVCHTSQPTIFHTQQHAAPRGARQPPSWKPWKQGTNRRKMPTRQELGRLTQIRPRNSMSWSRLRACHAAWRWIPDHPSP